MPEPHLLIDGMNVIGSRGSVVPKTRHALEVLTASRRTETAEKCHEHIALLPGTERHERCGLITPALLQR